MKKTTYEELEFLIRITHPNVIEALIFVRLYWFNRQLVDEKERQKYDTLAPILFEFAGDTENWENLVKRKQLINPICAIASMSSNETIKYAFLDYTDDYF